MEMFVEAFPGPGSRVQVSSGGGTGPIWSRDGRTLYYVRTGDKSTLMEVPMQTTPALRPGAPGVITAFPYLVSGPARSHDVTADGQRFLVATHDRPQGRPVTELQVIVNWR
jgi:eukaryotic-like serine/threonine-protein kinase